MAALGPDDTVLCTATMGFGALREFAEAAGSAGFSAISLSGGDYKSARAAGLSDADIRSLLADNNLRVAELDGVVDWLFPLPDRQGAGYDLDIPFFGHSQDTFFAIAEALDARSISAVDPFLRTAPLEQMAELLPACAIERPSMACWFISNSCHGGRCPILRPPGTSFGWRGGTTAGSCSMCCI